MALLCGGFIVFLGLGLGFVGDDGGLQRSDGGRDLRSGHDAAGAGGLADDGHDLAPLGFEHDQVGSGAGFEFVEHGQGL